MALFIVYVLRSSSTGRLYIGQTGNLERRLLEHQNGLARYTRGRGPWELILTEEFPSRSEAMGCELALKSGQGREALKRMISDRAGPPQAD